MSDIKGAVPAYQQEQLQFAQPNPSPQFYQGEYLQPVPMDIQSQQLYTGAMGEKTIPQQANPNNGYVPPPANYQNATPLVSVGMNPTPADCPHCRARQLTRIEYHSGNTTFAWAAAVCLLLGLGCIPFLMTSLKDVDHFCGNCGFKLATWHRSGRVNVLAHF